eukprot:Rmarinus@m.24718
MMKTHAFLLLLLILWFGSWCSADNGVLEDGYSDDTQRIATQSSVIKPETDRIEGLKPLGDHASDQASDPDTSTSPLESEVSMNEEISPLRSGFDAMLQQTSEQEAYVAETENKRIDEEEVEKKRLEAEKKRAEDESEREIVSTEAERKRVADEAERKRVADEAERKRVADEAERKR